jgi:hypothetical protein
MPVGTCQLTGSRGPFVRAHIIPAALTKPEYAGAPLVQGSVEYRPVRRWTSWYDTQLVTQEGETILRDYDTWAIRELRKQKLVWSGWGKRSVLDEPEHRTIRSTPYGVRVIKGIDLPRLRGFFLSLLWRAAATKLPEFVEVVLSNEDLERLRSWSLTRL